MQEEAFEALKLNDDFYRDRFVSILMVMLGILTAILLLLGLSLYLYLNKPSPVYFATDNEWRIQPAVSLDKPYLELPDLLQWAGDTLKKVWIYDFYRYDQQLNVAMPYFTPGGWKVFLNQLNNYANADTIQTAKLFIHAEPAGAPYLLQQGLLAGRYAWWVKMPIDLNYISYNKSYKKSLTLQVLIVRTPTLNNLSGVAIDNMIVVNAANELTDNG